ncbi:MAG: hypothetical protein ACPLRW_05555 [Moorellales bacterium]
MSTDYWPIMGYGVHVVSEMIDAERAARFLGVEEFDPEFELGDLLDALCRQPEGRWLFWASTGDFDWEQRYYLYCPAMVPWEGRDGRWSDATPEGVREAIVKLLGPLLRPGFGPADLEVGEVFAVGCG